MKKTSVTVTHAAMAGHCYDIECFTVPPREGEIWGEWNSQP